MAMQADNPRVIRVRRRWMTIPAAAVTAPVRMTEREAAGRRLYLECIRMGLVNERCPWEYIGDLMQARWMRAARVAAGGEDQG